jgi:hypothetical protein
LDPNYYSSATIEAEPIGVLALFVVVIFLVDFISLVSGLVVDSIDSLDER